ncbi:MAG: hypothetical protein QF473_17515 [Planctomycetota bacterium]|nr:hypothetical protein [Planctomycetota bacterium]
MKTVKHVLRSLRELNTDVAVVGGIAMSAWEHFRSTKDVDLLILLDGMDEDVLARHLAESDILLKKDTAVELGGIRLMQFLFEPPDLLMDIQIDLLIAKSDFHHEAVRRATEIELTDADMTLPVASCEDLIILKTLAGRIIDRVDAVSLLQINRAHLDIGYLMQWMDSLNIREDFSNIWAEALPGEEMPPIPP